MKRRMYIFGLALTMVFNGISGGLERVWAEEVGSGEGGIWVEEADGGGDETWTEETDGEDDEAGDEGEMAWEAPILYIKAINPGYKVDGINNVGEMIEITRGDDSDTPISLAGTAVGYTNSSGNHSILFEFPENSWMTGESILLRLASSPGFELANVTYAKTLAFSAGLDLAVDGEEIDKVCWTGKTGCYKAFTSANPTNLVRDRLTGEFTHENMYEPEYDAKNYHVEAIEEESEEDGGESVVTPQCRGLQFSEILSFYESDKAEQFIEFYNAGSSRVVLDGCRIRYKNKEYALEGKVEAEEYFVYYPRGFSLTKNPTTMNVLELVDVDEEVVDALEYPNGQRKGTAYAWIGYDGEGRELWRTTYAPTPGEANNYQEFKTCEAGKVINEATGNCVKVASVTEKTCREGYHLNLITGRCNKDVEKTEKTCKEGYYLNPETNRCRKIQDNTGADYSLEPEKQEENSSFVATWAVGGVASAGAAYLGWEFRKEIGRLWRKVFRRFH